MYIEFLFIPSYDQIDICVLLYNISFVYIYYNFLRKYVLNITVTFRFVCVNTVYPSRKNEIY